MPLIFTDENGEWVDGWAQALFNTAQDSNSLPLMTLMQLIFTDE